MSPRLTSPGALPLAFALILLPLLLGAWYHVDTRAPAAGAQGERVLAGSSTEGNGVDSMLRVAAQKAPFRMLRTASGVPYDPARSDPARQGMDIIPPRPPVAVSGIIAGPRSAAVIEGIPGRSTPLLMQVGDTAGGLRVRRISATAVVITGFDTTWTLSVRRPW